MSYILNIETATENCSVAIAKDGETIFCKQTAELGYSHAEKLHLFIEECLQQSEIAFSDLAAVAISQGPGSYTGLRIGVSTAKGICFALNIPLISTDTLEILARQVKNPQGCIISMLDARRMEVYCAVFSKNFQKKAPTEAKIIDETSFEDIKETVYFVGNCAEKAKRVLTKANFIFLDAVTYPSANEMSAISFKKLQAKELEDVAYFEPFYLKDFLIVPKKVS